MIWWRPELRILLVCTANVCRSPLAEALLRAHLRRAGLSRRIRVSSAGTRVAVPGRRPDPRVMRLLREAGVPAGRIRARQMNARLLAEHHLVLVMEPAQLGEVAALQSPDRPPSDLRLLGEFLPGVESGASIPDPYFSDWQGFLEVFSRVDRAIVGLMAWLPSRLKSPRGG